MATHRGDGERHEHPHIHVVNTRRARTHSHSHMHVHKADMTMEKVEHASNHHHSPEDLAALREGA